MRGRLVPSSTQTSSTQASWHDITDKPILYSYFPIWAEENADLNGGAGAGFEWAFGNGCDTPNGMGIIIPFDCELIALGLSLKGAATCEVEARKNTDSTGKSVHTSDSKQGLDNFEGDPVNYASGDVMGFRTVRGHGASNGGVIVAWFRRKIDGGP